MPRRAVVILLAAVSALAACGDRDDVVNPDVASTLDARLNPSAPPSSKDGPLPTVSPSVVVSSPTAAASAGTPTATAAPGAQPITPRQTRGAAPAPGPSSSTVPGGRPAQPRPPGTTTAAGLAPFDDSGSFGVTRRDGLVYSSAVNTAGARQQLSLDLYSPSGDTRRAKPVVVFVHGGGFRNGDRGEGAAALAPLVKRGYIGASIDYRIDRAAAEVTYPLDADERERVNAAVSDLKAAVRYLRANATGLGVDPGRIAVMGSSAGAVTALTVALTPDSPGDSSSNTDRSSVVCTAVSVMGASDPALAGQGDAGALFLHGDADTVVPYAAATQTEAAMRARGLPTQLTTFPGKGHKLDPGSPVITSAVTSWLRTHLARTVEPCV